MGFLKTYRNSIWRVPLIAVISGYFYTPVSYTHLDVYKRQAGNCAKNWEILKAGILKKAPLEVWI